MEEKETLSVAVFPTCVVTAACPGLLRSTLSLLRAAGVDASVVARYSCCGQPAYSAGRFREARRVGEAALAELAATTGPIVTPSGSCAAMIRKVWPGLFRREPSTTAAIFVSERTFELTQFLEPLDTPFSSEPPSQPKLTYHDSCHGLRELGLGSQGRALLRRAGYTVVECDSPQLCCGFGGVFSQILPEVAARVGKDKAESLMRAAPVTCGGDAACLLHLSTSLRASEYRGAHCGASSGTEDATNWKSSGLSEGSFRHIAELLAQRLAPDALPCTRLEG